MFKKFLVNQSKSITTAAIILGGASLLSRLLGILRDRVLAGEFGAGQELDIYYAAFRIPDLVYNLLILGALSAGFIPVFTSYVIFKTRAWKLLNDILNAIFSFILILSFFLILLAPWLVPFLTPGFSQSQILAATHMTQIMFLSLIFLSLSGIFGSVLQSFKKFFIYSVAPILYNLGIIIGALYFVPHLGIYGLAWGVVFGAFMHFAVQLLAVYSLGYKYQFSFNLKSKSFKKIISMSVPRTLGLIVAQINLLVVTIIGSTLAPGSITIFNFANNLQSFPLGLFGVSFAIAAFPTLAELADRKKDFIQTFSVTTRQILFLILPASALLIVLRAQIVRIVLGSGRFNWEDTILTLQALSVFALSLFAQSLILILVRAFFALKDSSTPFYIGLTSAIFNIILSLQMVKPFGVIGLALAFTFSSILQFLLLYLALYHKLGKLDGTKIVFSSAKILIATFMLAIVAQATKYPLEQITGLQTFLGILAQGAAAVLTGLITYLVVCYLLRSEELNLIIAALKKKIHKMPIIPEEIIEQEKLT